MNQNMKRSTGSFEAPPIDRPIYDIKIRFPSQSPSMGQVSTSVLENLLFLNVKWFFFSFFRPDWLRQREGGNQCNRSAFKIKENRPELLETWKLAFFVKKNRYQVLGSNLCVSTWCKSFNWRSFNQGCHQKILNCHVRRRKTGQRCHVGIFSQKWTKVMKLPCFFLHSRSFFFRKSTKIFAKLF